MTTVRVDFSGWEDLANKFKYASAEWPAELSAILGEIAPVAKVEVDKVYRYEPADTDTRPTFYHGGFGRSLRIYRGGGKTRPWISIGSSIDYAGIIEHGGRPDTGTITRGGGNRKVKTPGRRYYGPFADKIHEWAKQKFPSRGVKFADNVIAKIMAEGIVGRRVLARALSRENVSFYNFVSFTLTNRVDEFYSRFLAKSK